MHALLEANQSETMQLLESTYTAYVRKNSQQVLQLNERRQEAEKLLSSVQTFFKRAEGINFMKVQGIHVFSATTTKTEYMVDFQEHNSIVTHMAHLLQIKIHVVHIVSRSIVYVFLDKLLDCGSD